MRIRILIGFVLAAALPMSIGLFADGPAAQEIPHCLFAGRPCGTPQQLYYRISRCLEEPQSCEEGKVGDSIAGSGVTGSSLSSMATSAVSAKPLRDAEPAKPRQRKRASRHRADQASEPPAQH